MRSFEIGNATGRTTIAIARSPSLDLFVFMICFAAAMPVLAQSLSQDSQGQEPSEEQIEQFCAAYSQMSGSQRKQYGDQYEKYCERDPLQPETTIMQPADPLTGAALVQFDAEAMQPPEDWTVRSAVLQFEVRDPDITRLNRCKTSAVGYVVRRNHDWPAGKREVPAHDGVIPFGAKRPVSGTEVDITEWVQDWIHGDWGNRGVAFFGKNFSDALSRGNDVCVTELADFVLHIENEPER